MKKFKAIKIILFSLLALCSWVVGKSQQQPDSLMAYLEIAAKNNPTVLQRYYEYEAALQKVPQVGSLPDPELSLGIFLQPMELLGGNQVADIRLMQMFPWFGVLKSAKDEMSLMANAKYESFRDAKLQVYYDVQRTWYELQKLKQNIRISEKNIEILNTLERLAIIRYKTVPTGNNSAVSTNTMSSNANQNIPSSSFGMQQMGGSTANNAASSSTVSASPMSGNSMSSSSGSAGLSDIYRIQIEIGDLQNSIDLQKSKLSTIAAQFNSYLNRPPNAIVTIPDSLIIHEFQVSQTVLSDSILANNPMLGMLQYELKSLDARRQMVTKMGYPMVGIGLDYSLINKSEMSTSPMNGKDMIMPMVSATLPIYRKKYKAMQTEVDLLNSATVQNYSSTTNALQTEYYQAMELFQDGNRRIKLYSNQYQLAFKSLNIILRSYAAGSADLSDVLQVRQQTLDYEYKQIEAVADYNTSIAWLKRITAFSNN